MTTNLIVKIFNSTLLQWISDSYIYVQKRPNETVKKLIDQLLLLRCQIYIWQSTDSSIPCIFHCSRKLNMQPDVRKHVKAMLLQRGAQEEEGSVNKVSQNRYFKKRRWVRGGKMQKP